MTPLQQSPLFNAALARLGAHPQALRVEDRPVFLLRRALRPSLVTRGPATPAALEAYAKARLRILTPDDSTNLRGKGYCQLVTPSHIAALDLRPPLQDLRHGLKVKWRNRLTRAETTQSKIIHRPFDPNKDAWLLTAEAAQQRQRRYRGYPPVLIHALHNEAPKALHLFQLSDQGQPLAAMLFIAAEDTVTYHIGWSGPEGRARGAHTLLLWRAIAHFHESGLSTLDLGTVETEHSAGLARFKLGTGAAARPLGGTWLRLYRKT